MKYLILIMSLFIQSMVFAENEQLAVSVFRLGEVKNYSVNESYMEGSNRISWWTTKFKVCASTNLQWEDAAIIEVKDTSYEGIGSEEPFNYLAKRKAAELGAGYLVWQSGTENRNTKKTTGMTYKAYYATWDNGKSVASGPTFQDIGSRYITSPISTACGRN